MLQPSSTATLSISTLLMILRVAAYAMRYCLGIQPEREPAVSKHNENCRRLTCTQLPTLHRCLGGLCLACEPKSEKVLHPEPLKL